MLGRRTVFRGSRNKADGRAKKVFNFIAPKIVGDWHLPSVAHNPDSER